MSINEFTPVDSGHLDGVQYNSMDRKMSVRFKNGSIYDVHGVTPEDHQEFMSADSPGEHYHAVFKNGYHITCVR